MHILQNIPKYYKQRLCEERASVDEVFFTRVKQVSTGQLELQYHWTKDLAFKVRLFRAKMLS